MRTRIALVVLAALLALPLVQITSPVVAKNRLRTVTRTVHNTTAINLPESESETVSADLYPSSISVSGLKGTIRDVNLTLNNLTHDHPGDVEVLLVGPTGQTAIVMAHVGAFHDVADVTLRLDDEAAEPLPILDPLQSGTFRPTHFVFDGTNPNGTWRLFVQDSYGPTDSGAFAGGWALEITTKVKAKSKKKR